MCVPIECVAVGLWYDALMYNVLYLDRWYVYEGCCLS